jgi:EAL domain-containing protein (putative c-di-GMP-specific phosphodiesterase class I)
MISARGYSSLSYLTRFQIDALKIDQSFVQAMIPDPESIVRGAVISMAKSLRHRVIAEDVETSIQLASLQAMKCGEGQGYFFHRPGDGRRFRRFANNGYLRGDPLPGAGRPPPRRHRVENGYFLLT